jgi:hypothetical protein
MEVHKMKSYNEMTWKEQKLDYIKFMFEEKAILWKDEHDDRRLYSNTYFLIKEAIESLDEEPNIYVSVAMNNELDKDFATMERILERFKDR